MRTALDAVGRRGDDGQVQRRLAVELQVRSAELTDEEVQRLTEELAQTLREEAGVGADPPAEHPAPGARGEPITIGLLILTGLKSGAFGAVFNSISSFFHRSRKLEITLKRPDGTSLTLNSENVSEEERDRTLQRMRELME